MIRSYFAAVALVFLVAGVARAGADEAPYWPSEQEDRLTEVSDEIIEVIHQQRKARYEKDADKLKQLDERMKALKDEKVELLRASGELE